jgi:hypothetical protein
MGGMGIVAEIRTVFLSVTGRRIGYEKAKEVDPWFFPAPADEIWMTKMMEEMVRGAIGCAGPGKGQLACFPLQVAGLELAAAGSLRLTVESLRRFEKQQ